ncbi:MAG: beta-1,6-N-acetylglucosaminyltransferase [Steroidobacteraceae bacterium]
MAMHGLAFLILAHDDGEHLVRLVNKLAPHPVYIHVDIKATRVDINSLRRCTNAIVIQPRLAVHWAHITVVDATLALIQAVLHDGGARHTVLLSGHCYPLRGVGPLADFLAAHPDNDLMQMVRIPPGSEIWNNVGRHWRNAPFFPDGLMKSRRLTRLDHWLRQIYNRVAREFPRGIARELAPHALIQGSQWWALSLASLKEVADMASSDPKWRRIFRTTFAPDEMFFHTLLGASRRAGHQIGVSTDAGHGNLYNAPMHYIARVAPRWIENDPRHAAELVRTEKYFVRKISSQNRKLLGWIDAGMPADQADRAVCNGIP